MKRKYRGFDPNKPDPIPSDFKVPGYLVTSQPSVGTTGFNSTDVRSWQLHHPWSPDGNQASLGDGPSWIYSCDQLLRQFMARGQREDAAKLVDYIKQCQ
jgi:hypothetical protein